jgi:hypothetical protein
MAAVTLTSEVIQKHLNWPVVGRGRAENITLSDGLMIAVCRGDGRLRQQ